MVKYLGLFFLLIVSGLLHSQENQFVSVIVINTETERKYLILLNKMEGTQDTIANVPSHWVLVDTFIKAIDSISVIFRLTHQYSYCQYLKIDDVYWAADSIATWSGHRYDPGIKSKTWMPETYFLDSFNNVNRKVGNATTQFVLNKQKTKHFNYPKP